MPDSTNGTSKKTEEGLTGKKVWGWYHEGLDAMSKTRKEADICCAYYDNEQWTQEDLAVLKDRNQPALTINRTKPTIDLIIGTEAKARVEFHAAPRTEAHVQDASVATELIKFAMDGNDGEFICAEAFEEMIKAGWSYIEVSENDDPFGEKIKVFKGGRNELVYDPFSKEFDWSDSKYLIRGKWMELEDAVAKFPQHKEKLEMAVDRTEAEQPKEVPYHGTEDKSDRPGVVAWTNETVSGVEWVDRSRKRVRLLECWYKVPKETWLIENDLTGDVDEFDPGQAVDVLFQPGIKITKKMLSKIRICIVAGSDVLEDNPSPYRHNCYPFVPFWAYRKDKDGSPYGIILQFRDMQDEINKRRSKAMHLLNSNQIFATTDSIDQSQNDWNKVADEVSKPDGIVKLSNKPNAKFEIRNVQTQIEAQFRFEEEAKKEIEEISGVVGELKGVETNASSGRAIIARQIQGHTMLGKLFDNYRRSRQILGQLIWAMVQQYYTKPKTVRITDQMGGYGFLEINKYVTDGTEILVQNDISKAKVDIVIDEQVYHATIRQALMEQMMEMVVKLPPDIGLLLLDLVVEYSDLPKKAEMVQRIQQIQGALQQKQKQTQALEVAQAQAKAGGIPGEVGVGPGNDLAGAQATIESQMMGGMS